MKILQMKIYICGPMESAGGNWNFPLFDYAARRLRDLDCKVFSPADHIRQSHGSLENVLKLDKAAGRQARRNAIKDEILWICEQANGVLLLPGWERSSGATAERAVALAIGVPVCEAPANISLMNDNDTLDVSFEPD